MKKLRRSAARMACASLTLALLLPALPAHAVVRPKGDSALEQKAFRHPDLYIRQLGKSVDELPATVVPKARADLGALGGQRGYYDVRSGRWSLLVLSRPLVTVSGVNDQIVRNAVLAYVTQFQAQLGILATEVGEPRITVHDGGRVVQFHAQRVVNGVPVRDAWLKATINSGNLVLLGTQNWGTAALSTVPGISGENAFERVRSHAGTSALNLRVSPELVVVPLEKGDDPNQVTIGDGATYRLAWAVTAVARGDNGTWEGLVDAQSGEMLAFQDVNQYFNRQVKGGIFPVSNDGVPPDGTEQAGFPMPYAYILGTNFVTNSMGMVSGVGSQLRTNLTGPYVRMNDTCGVANEVSMCSDLDLGTSGGHDCVVPAGHSAGDTHASRSGFYELNRQIEGWRNRLPPGHAAQPWMNSQLTSNMNINDVCNAFWNGSSINFYREGGGCGNTGEIAAVFDHEWGHGLDNNDTDPTISSPGEAIADIYGILRVTDSCFGRGFFLSGTCDNGGSQCATCTGVRDLDWNEHVCNKPHDITWISQVGYPVPQPCTPLTAEGGCVGFPAVQQGPCGQETHCEGQVPAEAVYDLFARDLQGFGGLTNYGFNTALEITTRLTGIAAGNLATWYTCTQGAGGCAAITGYMLYLAADDDNGNLADGTPHIQAIFNAFNRHGIACPLLPGQVNSGCAGVSQTAPVLTATAGVNSASLSWGPVTGAAKYEIYRTEGVKGCDFGKIEVGETSGTSFVDSDLRDGFPVLYTVLPVGSNAACVGRMATCQTVTPLTPPAQAPDVAITQIPNSLSITTGDGDVFLDNCEQATLTFTVENAGDVDLTNVRITDVELVGKPGSVINTTLPLLVAASMPALGCPSPAVQVSVSFTPQGLNFDETLQVRITVEADELSSPRQTVITIQSTESNFETLASKTFTFETDFEGWKHVNGTYLRQPPGANATVNALYSTTAQDSSCDNIRSPEIKLSPTSTLSLFNQFVTEPDSPLGQYDRANVGLFDVATELRTTIIPDGGRLYTYAPGTTGGTCVVENQAGWATSATVSGVPFAQSSWSSGVLAGSAGVRKRLDVGYGTDSLVSGTGFDFDEVTITNFDLQVADTQSNVCDTGGGNQPPNAVNDSASTQLTTPVTINVLANDSDPDGPPPLTVQNVSDPPHGTAVNNNDGTVTYTANPDFVGNDTFTYQACDNGTPQLCDMATVTVSVFCAATPTGTFSDDLEPTPEPGWSFDVAVNTTGNAPITWAVRTDPMAQSPSNSFDSDATCAGGIKDDRLVSPLLELSSTSQLTFWHRFFFESTFDGGVLEVSINGGPWVDVLAGGGSFGSGGYNGIINTGFASPIAGQPAWTTSTTPPTTMTQVVVNLGAFAGNGVKVRWRLGCDNGFLTTGTGWWVDDIQVTNLNEVPEECPLPPNAENDTATTNMNTPVIVNVQANDSDPNGDPLTITSVESPTDQGGTAVNNGNGTVTYTPPSGFTGTDTFDYTICDDGTPPLCDTATVTITVNGTTPTPTPTPGGPTPTPTPTPTNGGPTPTPTPTPTNGGPTPTPTPTPTQTPTNGVPTPTPTPTPTQTPTNGVPTPTPTPTPTQTPTNGVPTPTPTQTPTSVPPTLTPTQTPTGVPPTLTPTQTPTSVVVPPTATPTPTRTPTPCSGAGCPGKVTGGGQVNVSGGKGNFGFNAKRDTTAGPISGQLEYHNHVSGSNVHSVSITSLSISGNSATFSGTCTQNGAPCTFSVYCEDNGEPGRTDKFTISVNGGPTQGGTLDKGNIQIHKN